MIHLTDLHKRFGGTAALDGATLSAPRGSVYGLVGPNGAGKTTLIRCLVGAMRPDSGQVTVDGQAIWEHPAAKAKVAYISDDVFYFPAATMADMMRYYRGLYPAFDLDRWNRLREVFNLPEKMPIRRMSRGMQKQAAFRLCLSLRPQVLVLDEPVDGLDPVMRRQVWSLALADVAEYGATVFVSSHNLRELEDVCDHVGVMHRGRLLLERSLSALQDGVQKLQIAFEEGREPDLSGLNMLHHSRLGRVHTCILRGSRQEAEAQARALSPIFFDLLPLSLEEIFIYELGGADYAVRDILV